MSDGTHQGDLRSQGGAEQGANVTVRAIEVRWSDGYANDPSLSFLVDGIPQQDDLVYEKRPCIAEQLAAEQVAIVGRRVRDRRDGWHLYWSETDGFAWFFTWGGKPDDGFAGWRRTVKLSDGTTEEIIGGWHTGPSAAVDAGFPQTLDVAIVRADEYGLKAWPRTGGLAYFVTLDRARRELARLRPDVELVESRYGWTVKWAGQPSKEEWMAAGPHGPGLSRRNHTCIEAGDVYSKLGPGSVAV